MKPRLSNYDRYASYQEFNSSSDPFIDRRFYHNFFFSHHYHANPEIIYVSKGLIDVTIDGMHSEIPAGHYCLILPWQIHSYTTPEESDSMIIVFPGKYVSNFVKYMSSSHGEPQVFTASEAINAMFMEYIFHGNSADEYILSSVLYGLCHSFITSCKIVPNGDRSRSHIIMKMMDYVSAHFRENLTLKDVAAALGYNYYYVSHFFCEYSGLPFQQFRNLKRIDYARGELIHTDKQVTDIAFECGFSSVRSFNRVFRDMMHMTPMEYRERHSMVMDSRELFIYNDFYEFGEVTETSGPILEYSKAAPNG